MDSNFVLFKCISMHTGARLQFSLYAINTIIILDCSMELAVVGIRLAHAMHTNWTFEDGVYIASTGNALLS